MTRATLPFVATALVAAIAIGCGKQGGSEAAGGAATASASAATASPSSSSSSSSSSASSAKPAGKTPFVGEYDAKVGVVHVQDKAPPFADEDSGALGKGELSLDLPAADGDVTGKASGALGAQTFTGAIEAGRLSGTLRPDGDPSALTGTLMGDVTGSGDARTIVGTIRASGPDGRVVREAAFTLKKK